MTRKLKFTGLMLLVASMAFSQVTPAQVKHYGDKMKIKDSRVAVVDSTTPVKTNEQAYGIIPNVGIVVKKNRPKGANTVVTTNDKGEAELKITETGDYSFVVNNNGNAATNNNNTNAKSAGGPVIGVKVWLGKNPGGPYSFVKTNDNGEAEFNNVPAGNYKILLQQVNNNNSPGGFKEEMREFQISAGAEKTIVDPSKDPTERVHPTIPNVGVVVKKNPGGGASRVGTTNANGQVEFTIKEKGDYTITLSSGGAAGSNNTEAAKNGGGPIKGVKVGLGHNPPGYCCEKGMTCCARAVTNNNGEVEFKNLEPGSYTLLVQAPCDFGQEWKDGKCVQVGDRTNNPKQN